MKLVSYILSTLAAACLLLPSCSSSQDGGADIEPEYSDDMPMNFTSTVGVPITRADNLLRKNDYVNFGVWTWKLPYGSTEWLNVMPHYRVSYNTNYVGEGRSENGWGYDQEAAPFNTQILKYWDLGTTAYEFKGYAPFCPKTSGTYVSMSGAHGEVTFNNISGHFPAKEAVTEYSDAKKDKVDWVYTYCKRTFSPLPDLGSGEKFDKDMTIGSGEYFGNAISKTNTQPLRFHHLLPKVIFRINVYDPVHEDQEQLVNIGIDVKANTVTMDKDVKYDILEQYGTTGNTDTPNAEYVDHNTYSLPDSDHPTVISFHKEKNTNYRDLSPCNVKVDGVTSALTYDNEGWLEVPQKAPVFTVKLTADGVPFSRTLDPEEDTSFPSEWRSDHIYIYIIKFNVKSKTLDTTSYIEEWNEVTDSFDITDW